MNHKIQNLTIHNFPVPDFVPVPGAETMHIISVISLIAGICLVGMGLLFLNRKKEKEKKAAIPWILISVGVLLIANHGIQLLF